MLSSAVHIMKNMNYASCSQSGWYAACHELGIGSTPYLGNAARADQPGFPGSLCFTDLGGTFSILLYIGQGLLCFMLSTWEAGWTRLCLWRAHWANLCVNPVIVLIAAVIRSASPVGRTYELHGDSLFWCDLQTSWGLACPLLHSCLQYGK